MPLTEAELHEREDRWIDRHSVDCYYCGALVDERDCIAADDFNGNDGGEICPQCQKKIQMNKTPRTKTWQEIDHALRAGDVPGVEPMTLEQFLAIHGRTDKKQETPSDE
jgi:hypothetical protein